MRSKKYYFRVFYHLLDVVMINSWILYKKVKANDPLSKMPLAKFREEVALILCKIGSETPNAKRGRPSMSEVESGITAKRHKGPVTAMPVKDVRLDGVCHWPEYMENRQRCKLPNCSRKTFIKCSKCGVALCINRDRNCYSEFHQK